MTSLVAFDSFERKQDEHEKNFKQFCTLNARMFQLGLVLRQLRSSAKGLKQKIIKNKLTFNLNVITSVADPDLALFYLLNP
jgi:hypothetical protein